MTDWPESQNTARKHHSWLIFGHGSVGYGTINIFHLELYSFEGGGLKKSTLCTLVKMLKIMDDPLLDNHIHSIIFAKSAQ